ncbi:MULTISPECIES: DUF6270 domain-containing protein [Cellulosimicrobium]|uniref:DUF6270 domain-containing protein n=1 Tax=Cellulosimicrobium TaxID=157920 RepID=UPI00119F9E1D|nr:MULTISPECIES: DUF6270 domain-containing protein [Cellulosimicrobium]MBE9937859.1 hypothetical protein [Cellulosimicrobium cellulans]
MTRSRVFIYGSNLARTAFDQLNPSHFELTHHVSRQSAVSAYSRAVDMIRPPNIISRTHLRTISEDFSSSLRNAIPVAAHVTDVVFLDILDEIFGVYILPDGSVITRSPELVESGAIETFPEGTQHVPFGTQKHFDYWQSAVAALAQLFENSMPHAHLVVLDANGTAALLRESTRQASVEIDAGMDEMLHLYSSELARTMRATLLSIGVDHPMWTNSPTTDASTIATEFAALIQQALGPEQDLLASTQNSLSPNDLGINQSRETGTTHPGPTRNTVVNLDGRDSVISRSLERLGVEGAPATSSEAVFLTARRYNSASELERVAAGLPNGASLVAFTTAAIRATAPGIRAQHVPAADPDEFERKVARHIELLLAADAPPTLGATAPSITDLQSRIENLERQLSGVITSLEQLRQKR